MNYILIIAFICNIISWPLDQEVGFRVPTIFEYHAVSGEYTYYMIKAAEFNGNFESIETEINRINSNEKFIVPNVFVAGTKFKYEKLNENFESVEIAINKITKNQCRFRTTNIDEWCSTDDINRSFKAIEDKLNEIRGE